MELFYASPQDCSENEVVLRDDEVKHLIKVLRKKEGEKIFVTDGTGNLYEGIITYVSKNEVQCSVLNVRKNVNELTFNITLAISLLKNPNRFDFCVEKATELGVQTIIPFRSERTLVQRQYLQRWKHIALAAMKQSCRSVLPEIKEVYSFEEVVKLSSQYTYAFCAHEKKSENVEPLAQLIHKIDSTKSMLLLIGPEGGFTNDEIESAIKAKCAIISLGNRRLRSETAALAALSIIGCR